MKFYRCFIRNCEELGEKFVMAESGDSAHAIAVRSFSDDGFEVEYSDCCAEFIDNIEMVVWLLSHAVDWNPKVIESDHMFCDACEHHSGGQYYLMHNGVKHVCVTEGDE